jgi:F-type H+-transporting ATPase subunit epsilon
MDLKILLPFKVFAETKNVNHIVFETSEGSYGLLPQRLDCVAAIVPGIFSYEAETGGPHYVAVDDGILVKAGSQVLLLVQNAVGGADLGMLSETVKKEFAAKNETEMKARSLMQNLESGFMFSFNKFRNR